jgi:GT2 family glycosyltransferase
VTARPLVSAIVPTRNRAHVLGEALDSACRQEGVGEQFDLEIVVVDDASTDATARVAARYPRLRYLRLPAPRGAAAARNAGIAASRARYVAFLDDDDLWLPHKLRLQVPVLEAHPEAGAVYARCVVRHGHRMQILPFERRPPTGWIYPALLTSNVCGGVLGLLIRREALAVTGLFDETLPTAEDYDLWLCLAFHFPFLFVPQPVAVYRWSSQGKYLTALRTGTRSEALRRIVEKGLARLPETAAYAALRQRARAAVETWVVIHVAIAQDPAPALRHMLDALRRCPGIVRDPRVRDSFAWTARRLAVASSAPLATTHAFCTALGAALHGALPSRSILRRLLATVWGEVAAGLLLESRAHRHDAWPALAQAIRRAPSQVARKGLRALLHRAQHRAGMPTPWRDAAGGLTRRA